MIPLGWILAQETDPDTGETYWTLELESEETPLSAGVLPLTVPKTGDASEKTPVWIIPSILALASLILISRFRNRYQPRHMDASAKQK